MSSRSPSQSVAFAFTSVAVIVSLVRCSCPAGNHDLFAAYHDRVFLERFRRRTGNHPAGHIVSSVMAGAPDLFAGVLILDGAVQVCADGGERFPLGLV